MTKDTRDFIFALKHSADKTLKETAIKWLCEWSDSVPESYSEPNLFSAVKMFFLDYVDTCDNSAMVWREYFDTKHLHSLIGENLSDTEIMLIVLDLVQVKKNGKFINGFWDSDTKDDFDNHLNESMIRLVPVSFTMTIPDNDLPNKNMVCISKQVIEDALKSMGDNVPIHAYINDEKKIIGHTTCSPYAIQYNQKRGGVQFTADGLIYNGDVEIKVKSRGEGGVITDFEFMGIGV